MPEYHCFRCQKQLGFDKMFQKNVPAQPSGAFLVGHIGGNPHLPLMGVPINTQHARVALCCSVCGEEVHQIATGEEREQIDEEAENRRGRLLILAIITAIGIFIEFMVCWQK